MIDIDLETRITELIKDFVNASEPDSLNLRQLAAARNVLPLVWDMGGVSTISPNGEVISFPFRLAANGKIVAFPWDASEDPKVESDLRLRNNALFAGSKKYPELESLIEKPEDARVCPHCRGSGMDPNAKKLNIDTIICYCGGLGWLP